MSEERVLSDVVWTPERGAESPEVRSIAWNNFLLSDEMFMGQWRTAAEIRITPETALASTVVLACCRILAETISSLPLHVMRRQDNGGSTPAADIPLYKVLAFAPNEWQTKFEFFEQMVMNLTLWGNSYSLIRSGRYGAVSALDNLHPSRMDVERLENGRLRYSYTNPENGRLERYTQDQIMHIRWTAEPDGIKGMVPIEIAREAIALARACEIHASKYWANSARPGVVLQTDNSLSPEAAERLRDNWERLHKGSDRAHRTAILTNGLKVEQVGFNAEQSQFLDSRRFQSEEIARVYRLPISLVQGQSSGNMEATGQEFVTYTLVPWLRRIESGISRSLIYNDDVFFAEFDTKALMRANSNARAAFYSTMQNLGIYSINDSRHDEGLPPIEHGDKHFVAMNMIPLEQAVKGPQQPQDPMAAMMGGAPGGPPPEMPGAKPSLPGVKVGEAPPEAPKGQPSEKKPIAEGDVVTWGDGKIGELKHIMEQGTLDLKSGEKVEVQPGEPVALVVDPQSGEEFAVKVAELQKAKKAEAVEQRRLSPQNQSLYDAQEQIVREKGRWSQADSHYQERNPFASRGILCRNCVYYEEGGSCEIVKGSIRPDAICKLWIIPDERLSIPEQRVEEESRAADCGRDESGKFGPKNQCQDDDGDSSPDSDGKDQPSSSDGDGDRREPTGDGDGDGDGGSDPSPDADKDFKTGETTRAALKSIRESGGFSVNPFTADSPTTGYMVSVVPAAETILDSPDAVTDEVMEKFLRDNEQAFKARPTLHVGGWLDKATGKVYLDLSEQFDDLDDAIDSAESTNQLAIWDLNAKDEIRKENYDGRRTRKRKESRSVRSPGRARRKVDRSGDPRTRSPDSRRREGEERATAQERLIATASRAMGSKMPRVEVRDIGEAIAVYDHRDDVLLVSPTLPDELQAGYASQANPYIHEAAHRIHARANPQSYEAAVAVEFSAEQRSLIAEQVSAVAAINGRELVAEVLAGVMAGKMYGHDILSLAREVAGSEVIP